MRATNTQCDGIEADNRGVSVTITHVLTLGITAVLIIGLLYGAGNFLKTQEERAAAQQYDEVGNDVVAQIHALDRLNATGEQVQTTVEPNYPGLVFNDVPYNIGLVDADRSDRYGDMSDVDVLVTVDSRYTVLPREYPVTNKTDLDVGSTVRGAQPVINLCPDPQEITLGECE